MTWHLVTTEFPPQRGGISSWSAAVADALHAAGESVMVHARAPIPPVQRPYPVIPMAGRSWSRWQGLWAWLSVRPRLKAGDRVLCATWPLATHLVGGPCPVSIAAHGSDLTRPPSGPGREATLSAAAALYPVSHFLGAQLRRPYTVLPYPIRPQAQARRGEAILCIARLGPLKGVDRVLRLGARLGRPVVVVGEGPERPALERLAGELGVEAHFHGELAPEQIPWDGTWALALFSRTAEDGSGGEGLGLVLLEAASRGIPTLGSAVGGIPEAASVVLHDPETDPIPPLPTADSVQAWLEATHGPTAMRNVLKP